MAFRPPSGGAGNVVGPATSTNNAIPRYDGTTGELLKDSGVLIDDTNNMTGVVDITSTGTTTMKIMAADPEGTQAITAASDTVTAQTNSHFAITTSADFVMTSTPTIPDGIDGQILFLHNVGTFTITLQDESVLPGSNFLIDAADGLLRPDGIMTLLFDTSTSAWHVVSNPNSSVAGANADTIAVRNTSGAAIPAGKAVFITGFSVGQGRPTIDLADANDATKIPSIGITATSIGNNTNGDVISAGSAIGIINTSAATANDGVWVSTVPGEVVFVRPNVDFIQRLGTVTRSNANGNILVQGAGRINDVPITAIFGGGEGGIVAGTNGTVRAPDLTGGTDIVGADIILRAGLGTGIGDVGQVIIQTPRVGVTGATPHIFTTLVTLDEDLATVTGDLTVTGTITGIPSASLTTAGLVELATTAEIDTGTDTTRAIPVDQFVASDRNIRFIAIRVVEAATDVAVATLVGGDFVMPFTGTLIQSDTDVEFFSAATDTAGTTGTMVVDVNIGGTTVMTTNKLDIETTEKSTTTATTQPDLTTTAVTAGDVFTFDIDAIHTTAAKGLTIYMAIRLT